MQQSSMTAVDYTALNKAQLVAMVAARGEALMAYIAADNALRDKIDAGTLCLEDMQRMEATKEAALLKLGETETAVIFGRSPDQIAN